MRFESECEVCLDVNDVLCEMDEEEKGEMYEALCKEFSKGKFSYKEQVIDALRRMTPSEIKIALCDALYVPSYVDSNTLRNKLEDIITAK